MNILTHRAYELEMPWKTRKDYNRKKLVASQISEFFSSFISLGFASSLAAAVARHYTSNHENLWVKGPRSWKAMPMKRKPAGSSQRYEMRHFPVCGSMVSLDRRMLPWGLIDFIPPILYFVPQKGMQLKMRNDMPSTSLPSIGSGEEITVAVASGDVVGPRIRSA